MFDLLALLRLFSQVTAPSPDNDSLEVIVVTGRSKLGNPGGALWFGPMQSTDSTFAYSAEYNAYSNREIADFHLNFNNVEYTSLHDSLNLTIRKSSLSNYFYHSDSIPWSVSARDATGRRYEASGKAVYSFPGPNIVVDWGSFPYVGEELTFPLVLKSPWQRFVIFQTDYPVFNFPIEVDLNPAGADSVVFADIDTLAAAIMWQVVKSDYPYPGIFMLISPAVDIHTQAETQRLIFDPAEMQSFCRIVPRDGNHLLLYKLGIKEWVSRLETKFYDSKGLRSSTEMARVWEKRFR